jgi:hypothetical protein
MISSQKRFSIAEEEVSPAATPRKSPVVLLKTASKEQSSELKIKLTSNTVEVNKATRKAARIYRLYVCNSWKQTELYVEATAELRDHTLTACRPRA